jgi:hypothetical protein
LIHLVAHIEHIQTLIQLSEGVPAYGVFRPKKSEAEKHNHWIQFKLKKGEEIKFEDVAFLATNLEGRHGHRQDVILQTFSSVSTSRPLPEKHEWSGLTTTAGDSFLNINSKDPKFKADGNYFLNVHLASPQEVKTEELIFYSVVAHTLTKTSNVTLDPPVLLLDRQVQSAYAPGNHFAYFTAYVDKARVGRDVRVVVKPSFGGVKTWASTKTTKPSEKNHEWAGKVVSTDEVELVINVKEASFIFIGVWSDPDFELLSTYDVHFHRGD